MTTKNLTTQDILNKEFNVEFKGYNPTQVDSFLDLVIEDYQVLQDMIDKMNKEKMLIISDNQLLIEENKKLAMELRTLQEQKKKLEDKGLENVDIITRLSKLESIVHED